jgi:hypothetical protein
MLTTFVAAPNPAAAAAAMLGVAATNIVNPAL